MNFKGGLRSNAMASAQFSQIRYLSAKKTVDDRALNTHVWKSLRRALAADRPRRLRIVEIGAGIGTMIERTLDWGLLEPTAEASSATSSPVGVDLTAIDPSRACLVEARRRLLARAVADRTKTSVQDTRLDVYGSGVEVAIEFDPVDHAEFATRCVNHGAWHLVIANAVLDLVDLSKALPLILSLLEPGGLFYFATNFDGHTMFLPTLDDAFESLIYDLYHRSMHRGRPGSVASGSRSGRLLYNSLRTLGAEIVDMGSSDWVVFPSKGAYPQDEGYFLHCLLTTIGDALLRHPALDARRFDEWLARRHDQVDRGELAFICHQLDFVGRVSVRRIVRHQGCLDE